MPEFLYHKVYKELKRRITSDIYVPNSTLPSEASLRKEFDVSQITIRRAIRELALDGLLESRQGKGNYVRASSNDSIAIGLSSFTSDVAAGRLKIVRTLLADEMVPAAEEIAEKLEVQPGSLVRNLVRLDSSGGVPFSIDEAFIPPALVRKIDYTIASSPLFMHLLQKAEGLNFTQTQYNIHIEKAGKREQEFLKVEPDSPLLTTGELVFEISGRPALWIVSKYPAYRCRLTGTVKLVQKKTEHGTIGE